MEDFQRAGEYADVVADRDREYGILLQSMIAQDAGLWAEAERLQRGIIRRAPDYPYAQLCLAVTLLNGKCDLDGATEALGRSLSLLDKPDKEFFMRLGEMYVFSRNPLEAARGYEGAARCTSDDPSPLLPLLSLYLDAGRESDMLNTLERMEKQYPGWVETMYARVLAENARGNADEALGAFQLIKDKFPFMAGKLVSMEGVLLAAVGDANGPLLILENMRLKNAEDAAGYSDLGFAYLLLGETDRAAQALDKAEGLIDLSKPPVALSVRKTQGIIYANRAELNLQLGDVEQSVEFIEKAVEYGLYPTMMAWADSFSEVFMTERGKALLTLFPPPGEAWDVSVLPQFPGM
jgi:tetratricopeptide (TPR) repeat protein